MKTIFVKPYEVERKWYIIDATGKRLGKVAVDAVNIIRGKNKPLFVPHQEVGDYVIIINAEKIEVTANKAETKMYYNHSNFPGGLRSEVFKDVIQRRPTKPLEEAIRGMLPHNRLGRKIFNNVKIYAGAEHPHGSQQPIVVE